MLANFRLVLQLPQELEVGLGDEKHARGSVLLCLGPESWRHIRNDLALGTVLQVAAEAVVARAVAVEVVVVFALQLLLPRW